MKHYTTHLMDTDTDRGRRRMFPACGAILGQHGAGAMDADPAAVDCRRCLARMELRDLLANAEAARTMYGAGSYARGVAASLLPAINAAAERAGFTRTDHAERERLGLDSLPGVWERRAAELLEVDA